MSYYRSCFAHLKDIERRRIVTAPNVVMRLNRGERPEPLPPSVQELVLSRLWHYTQIMHQYPSYQPFYDKLAKYIGFPKEQIVVGAGIEEFIRTLMFLSCDPGQKAAVLWPTCAMYDIYASAFDVDLIRIKPIPGQSLLVGDLLEQVEKDTKILFLPNPGQPIETCYDLSALRSIANWCWVHKIILAVDEAHFGFGAPTALPLVNEFDNVLVMRTFSKLWGAASIRVGFVVGQAPVIKPLDAVRPSGEISGPSMAIASALLDVKRETQDETAYARDWLRDTINHNLPYKAYGKYGFSVLVEFPSATFAAAVRDKLADQGVYVKARFPKPADKCILLACGSMSLMERFYTIFTDVVKQVEPMMEEMENAS